MSAVRGGQYTDPTDAAYTWNCAPNSIEERQRARLAVVLAGRDTDERRQLLTALGLDQPDEIRTQLHPKD